MENQTILYPFFESLFALHLIWPMVPYVKLLGQLCLESRNLYILEKYYGGRSILCNPPKQHLHVAAEHCTKSSLSKIKEGYTGITSLRLRYVAMLYKFILKCSFFRVLWILKLQIRDCGFVYIRRVQVSVGFDFITAIKEKQNKVLALLCIPFRHSVVSSLCSVLVLFQGTASHFILILLLKISVILLQGYMLSCRW